MTKFIRPMIFVRSKAWLEDQPRKARLAAAELRRRSVVKYYQKPNFCRRCGKVIKIKSKASEARRGKFCSHSCSAIVSNKARAKKKERRCKTCGVDLVIGSRCVNCRMHGTVTAKLTKGKLFSSRGSWMSARNTIRFHANRVYEASGLPMICLKCKYDKHVQICHRKSVASFSDSSLVRYINRIENLVALCPNHHWEFDAGILELAPVTQRPE